MKIKKLLLLFVALFTASSVQAKMNASNFAGASPLAMSFALTGYYGSQATCSMQSNKVFKDGICYNKATFDRDYCNNQYNRVYHHGKCHILNNTKKNTRVKSKKSKVSNKEEKNQEVATTTTLVEENLQPIYFQSLDLWA